MASVIRHFAGIKSAMLLLPEERTAIRGTIRLHMGRYPLALRRISRFRIHQRRGEVDRAPLLKTGAGAPV